MNLRIAILPNKVLADGTHRIRIGMSHKGATRYFVTRFKVNNPNCISNGAVVGVPNASYINQILMKEMTDIYRVYDTIDDAEYLSCAQLKERIEKGLQGLQPVTLYGTIELFTSIRQHLVNAGTLKMQKSAIDHIKGYFDDNYLLKNMTSDDLYGFREYMTKCGLGDTTQSITFQFLRQVVTYALRHDKVAYKTHPFKNFKRPKALTRDVAITLEELRRIRDCEFSGYYKEQMESVRDLFMLSFYLCGMNIVDMYRIDLTKDSVKFHRKKTESRRPQDEYTEFAIQPEARRIIDKRYTDGGFVCYGKKRTLNAVQDAFNRFLPIIAERCGITTRLVFYSARKTFAQLANELMIKDSIIEYCIGDAVSNRNRTIGSYISINRRIADKAIRKVFDAVASTKSMDELVEDSI